MSSVTPVGSKRQQRPEGLNNESSATRQRQNPSSSSRSVRLCDISATEQTQKLLDELKEHIFPFIRMSLAPLNTSFKQVQMLKEGEIIEQFYKSVNSVSYRAASLSDLHKHLQSRITDNQFAFIQKTTALFTLERFQKMAKAKEKCDFALSVIWEQIKPEIGVAHITTPDQISNWIRDPVNNDYIRYEIEGLDVANAGLKILPKEFGYMETLRELDLSGNELESLPDAIKDMGALEILDISNNRLTSLPKGIEDDLLCLRYFDISNNQLTSFPQKLSTTVEEFHCKGNPVESKLEQNPAHCSQETKEEKGLRTFTLGGFGPSTGSFSSIFPNLNIEKNNET